MPDVHMPYELAEVALSNAIRDLRMNMRSIASDQNMIVMLHHDLAVLTRTMDEVKEIAERGKAA